MHGRPHTGLAVQKLSYLLLHHPALIICKMSPSKGNAVFTEAHLTIGAGNDHATIFTFYHDGVTDCSIKGHPRLVGLYASEGRKPSPRPSKSKNIPVEGASSALDAVQRVTATLPAGVEAWDLALGYTFATGHYVGMTIIAKPEHWLSIEPQLRYRKWVRRRPRRRATIRRRLLATGLAAEVRFVKSEVEVRLKKPIPLPAATEPLTNLAGAFV